MKEIPVYQHIGTYAREHGELEQFRNSFRANIACKEAIEAAIREHYRNNCLDSEAPKQVVDQFGYDRVFHVLANTVKQKYLPPSLNSVQWSSSAAPLPSLSHHQ